MRILLISPYPPTRDGIGTYTQGVVEAMVAQGHTVGVIAARAADPGEPVGPEVLGVLGSPDPVEAFAPDVVHVQFAIAAYAAGLPRLFALMRTLKRRGHRIVTTMHEVTRDTNSLRGPGRMIYRALAARSDMAIVHTQGSADCLARLMGTRTLPTTVIPHPRAELPDATTTPEELRADFGLGSGPVVLSFGFIDVDKGIQDLIRGVALLKRPGLRLVIAGTVRRRFGPFRIFEARDRIYLAHLRRVIAQTGLGGAVTFAGYVPSGSMAPWFGLADVAALTYRRCEASGVASLATAAGTPLLTTAVGELTDLSAVPDLAPRDPAGVAAGLAQLLDSPPPRDGATPDGISLEQMVAETLGAYGDALAA